MGVDRGPSPVPTKVKLNATWYLQTRESGGIVQSYGTVAVTRRLSCTSSETAVRARHTPVLIEALG